MCDKLIIRYSLQGELGDEGLKVDTWSGLTVGGCETPTARLLRGNIDTWNDFSVGGLALLVCRF